MKQNDKLLVNMGKKREKKKKGIRQREKKQNVVEL